MAGILDWFNNPATWPGGRPQQTLRPVLRSGYVPQSEVDQKMVDAHVGVNVWDDPSNSHLDNENIFRAANIKGPRKSAVTPQATELQEQVLSEDELDSLAEDVVALAAGFGCDNLEQMILALEQCVVDNNISLQEAIEIAWDELADSLDDDDHDDTQSEGIINPNSTGQGYDDTHLRHPLHDVITSHGYGYSHSTPIHQRDGTIYVHHTYARGKHKVGVNAHDGSKWETKTTPASGHSHTGSGAESLDKHLKSKTKRYFTIKEDALDEQALALLAQTYSMTPEDMREALEKVAQDSGRSVPEVLTGALSVENWFDDDSEVSEVTKARLSGMKSKRDAVITSNKFKKGRAKDYPQTSTNNGLNLQPETRDHRVHEMRLQHPPTGGLTQTQLEAVSRIFAAGKPKAISGTTATPLKGKSAPLKKTPGVKPISGTGGKQTDGFASEQAPANATGPGVQNYDPLLKAATRRKRKFEAGAGNID